MKKEEYQNSIENIFEEVTLLEKELQEIDITYATENKSVINRRKYRKVEKRINKLKEEQETIKQEKETSIKIKEETQKK